MPRKKELTIAAINERLKAARTGVRVMQRGDRLSLQATLPPKPGSGKTKPHQQVISLGIYANPAGLETAEAKALEVGSLLAQRRFDWVTWEDAHSPDQDSVRLWIDRYRCHYLEQRRDDPQAEQKWNEREWLYLKHLPPSKALDAAVLIRAVQRTAPNSRNRQLACQSLGRLAQFAKLDADLSFYAGSYTPARRELPTDDRIVETIDGIKNRQWQAIAALMATYGLRDYGERTARTFKRYGLGFTPYDLRHAYAIRASVVLKVPIAVAAAWMGHSPEVHWRTYNRWISEQQHQTVFEEVMSRRGQDG